MLLLVVMCVDPGCRVRCSNWAESAFMCVIAWLSHVNWCNAFIEHCLRLAPDPCCEAKL
jgi:hypothetical protein